ncbi:hypothetical protein BHYA_0923g00010 [Botrytis hyacinthi]|uniref:Tyrosinase copper-binding domain-containing protein n=1 Tax=Botrytis hyacinthi TaxID=278943 RepID=A0A4Z1G7I6_9HELO|nr:hypothetical protein BHYA_0923g00010 [Botrytis hyacinthi]
MVQIFRKAVQGWLLVAVLAQAASIVVPHKSPRQDLSGPGSKTCTSDTRLMRREWGNISTEERLAYINSVKCLMKLPSRIPKGIAPGAQSHYDDFVATHINRTVNVHLNGAFPPFHREYIHVFENALRTECGYQYALPYVEWSKWATDLAGSPLFDGSETSLGGDGAFDPNSPVPVVPGSNATLENGNGGGCVVTGPFTNYTPSFQLFPQVPDFRNLPALKDPLGYHPHCLTRNLNNAIVTASYSNPVSITNITSATDYTTMVAAYSNGGANGIYDLGVHGGGHVGAGQEMWDFWASPSDPVFWLHHGFVDKIYTAWQDGHYATRVTGETAVAGTDALFDDPSGKNVTLDYFMDMGFLAAAKPIREILDVSGGDYCYGYE